MHGKVTEIRNNRTGLFEGLPEKFKVTTSHGTHGTIAGARWVKWGKDAEFAVTPEEGYEIAGATVNGKAIEFDPSADSITVKNVRKTSSVRVEFRD